MRTIIATIPCIDTQARCALWRHPTPLRVVGAALVAIIRSKYSEVEAVRDQGRSYKRLISSTLKALFNKGKTPIYALSRVYAYLAFLPTCNNGFSKKLYSNIHDLAPSAATPTAAAATAAAAVATTAVRAVRFAVAPAPT